MPAISDVHQSEPARGQHFWPHQIVSEFRIEEGGELLDGSSAAPYFQEASTHPSHHPSCESEADDVDPNLSPAGSHFDGTQFAPSVLMGIEFFAEREEIVGSYQVASGLLHRVEVEWSPVRVAKARFERISRPDGDAVAIPPIEGTEPAVKAFAHLPGILDSNIERQNPIQGSGPIGWLDSHVGIKMADLGSGMGTAIGPARSDDLAFFARDLAHGICQCSLDGSLSGRCGPAAKVGPVVGDDEFDSVSRQARERQFAPRRRVAVRSSSVGCSRRCDP